MPPPNAPLTSKFIQLLISECLNVYGVCLLTRYISYLTECYCMRCVVFKFIHVICNGGAASGVDVMLLHLLDSTV